MKPKTFHHNHEMAGKNIQSIIFNKKPTSNPIHAPSPFTRWVKRPSKNTPNIGPLIKEPILFIASKTVLAILST